MEPRLDLAQRGRLHVVVVVVAEEDDVDGRQIGNGVTRPANASRAEAPEGPRVGGEHGIREDRGPSRLDQECRVADEGRGDASGGRLRRRQRRGRHRHGCGPRPGLARAPPFEEVSGTARLRAVDVEEPLAVAVIGYRVSH